MTHSCTRFLRALLLIAGLALCATRSVAQSDSLVADPGYFLSMKQKGQLIVKGQIQDNQGRWYDVWVVPGYREPATQTRRNLKRAGQDMAEYVQPEKYRDLVRESGDAFEWAYKDCLVDFTIKGVPRAWGRYLKAAKQRSDKRVFGWWFAYPWAVMEGTVNTGVRIPLGLAGTATGTAVGVAVVPAFYTVNSTVKAGWHGGVKALLVPGIAGSWNTVIAPPMALVGQKPAPSRVDGFWVKQLGLHDPHPLVAVSAEDVDALVDWALQLRTTCAPIESERQALRDRIKEQHRALELELKEGEALLKTREQETVSAFIADSLRQQSLIHLQNRELAKVGVYQAYRDVRELLHHQHQLPWDEVNRVMQLLESYPLYIPTDAPPNADKTDPAHRSQRLIKGVGREVEKNLR